MDRRLAAGCSPAQAGRAERVLVVPADHLQRIVVELVSLEIVWNDLLRHGSWADLREKLAMMYDRNEPAEYLVVLGRQR